MRQYCTNLNLNVLVTLMYVLLESRSIHLALQCILRSIGEISEQN